jgi:hypothetical protein
LSDEYGSPINLQDQVELTALPHLHSLISNSISSLKASCHTQLDDSLPIIIVGFSKGCVCLNKICYEMNKYKELSLDTQEFVNKFQHFMWLDSGHNGKKCALITDKDVINNLYKRNIRLYLYGTPFQLNTTYNNKKFISKEYNKMIELLNESYQMKFKTKIYFQEKDPDDFQAHFELLSSFDCNLIE